MDPFDLHVEHALRRNGVGARVLVALSSLGLANDHELSAATGAVAQRIRWSIEGRDGAYRPIHAMEPLGLVETRPGPRGPLRALTRDGERWAWRVEDGFRRRGVVARTFREPDS
jgi:hypothetical protein